MTQPERERHREIITYLSLTKSVLSTLKKYTNKTEQTLEQTTYKGGKFGLSK